MGSQCRKTVNVDGETDGVSFFGTENELLPNRNGGIHDKTEQKNGKKTTEKCRTPCKQKRLSDQDYFVTVRTITVKGTL